MFSHGGGSPPNPCPTCAAYLDFTTSSLPSGSTCTRSSGTVYQQTSASTYAPTAITAGNCLYESWRTGLPGGWYVFHAFGNEVDYTNPTGTGWSAAGNITASAFGGQTCADSTTADVYTITTTSADGTQRYSYVNGTQVINNGSSISMWVRDNVSNPPVSDGNFGTATYPSPPYQIGLGTGTAWRHMWAWTGANLGQAIMQIYPTGPTVLSTSLGAIDICGVQVTADESGGGGTQLTAQAMMPLVPTSTSSQDITLTTPAQLVQSGDLDVSVSFVGLWPYSFKESSADWYAWSAQSADGQMGVRLSTGGGQAWVLTVRGVDVLSMAGTNGAGSWSGWLDPTTSIPGVQETTIHCWYRPATNGDHGLPIRRQRLMAGAGDGEHDG
jgi:hypothetical protein